MTKEEEDIYLTNHELYGGDLGQFEEDISYGDAIGRGTISEVYKGLDKKGKMEIAVKCMPRII